MHCNLFRMGAHAGPCRPLKVPTKVTRSGSWNNRAIMLSFISSANSGVCDAYLESQWRQCDVLGNILLGNLRSYYLFGCYFDTYHLPMQTVYTFSCKQYSLTAVASFSRILYVVTKQKAFDNEFKVLTWPINSPILHDKLVYGGPTPQLKSSAANILVKKPVHASMGQGCFDSIRGILGRCCQLICHKKKVGLDETKDL